ncbi:hypothetical protein [Rhizobium leguminosarum]|uniref:hypothetical protein n=1 Tax=Rhizobium leguminosarum TaxID=384 RepID=UPI000485C124|nr:hypothetical protein [Rhizobium leguminosarum]WFT84363.1 hypothetical protein QA638_15655 [Rhizobium leguminosarum]
MFYALAGAYAVVAVFFLCMAGYYTGRIGHQAQGFYHEDLWQIRWERLMMGALPFLAIFFLMLTAPIIIIKDGLIELIFASNFKNGDDYLLVGIVWIIWAAAWLVVGLCVIALAGTVYYRWKVADRHARQHEHLQRNRDIVQIAYSQEKWGRWVRVKRSKKV